MSNILKINSFNKKSILSSPETAGVYVFLNKKNVPIYIGKAKNLKRRLTSYTAKDLSLKTKAMTSEAEYFSVIKVVSELESLLLEAKLVRKLLPKYNSQLRDDKHPLYIRVTKEEYPKVLTARKNDLLKTSNLYFGPFPSSTNVKGVLKMLRRIFPYSTHPVGKRKCLYAHIGLCNPCPNEIANAQKIKDKAQLKKQYLTNIGMIKSFLKGNLQSVKLNLKAEMNKLAKEEKYEEAKILRNKVEQLEYITQPITPINIFLENPNHIEELRSKETSELNAMLSNFINISSLQRIECYDIAHLTGTYQTASMVTFIEGEPDKNYYRHFKIRHKKGSNDIASMKEVAERRVRYLADWGVPDLIIVDGGKAQVNVFISVFANKNIPVVGLAKRYETLVIPLPEGSFKEIKVPKGNAKNLIQRLRNEAHRFARRYHHHLLHQDLLGQIPQNRK